MTEALNPRDFGILPAEELVEMYGSLTPDELEVVNGRAVVLRYGPTGMNYTEAVLAAMQERVIQQTQVGQTE